LEKLTPREAEVLSLYLREGDLTKVAETLGVSINTVKTQRAAIMRKLAAKNAVELTLSAVRRGLVDLNPKERSNEET
jgi:DNA-binding NarL/FixJ family response regulator